MAYMRLVRLSCLLSLWALGCSLSHNPDLPSNRTEGDGDLGVDAGGGAVQGSGGFPPTGGVINGSGGHVEGVGGSASEAGQGGETAENLGGSR